MEGKSAADPTTTTWHKDGVINLRDPDTGFNIYWSSWSAVTNDHSQPGTASTFTFVAFPTVYNSTGMRTAYGTKDSTFTAVQINFCLKCHDTDGAAAADGSSRVRSAMQPFDSTGTLSAISSGTVDALGNLFLQFSPTNASYHPVRGKGNNNYCDVYTMVSPWNQYLKVMERTALRATSTKWTGVDKTTSSDNVYAVYNVVRAEPPVLGVDYLHLSTFSFTTTGVPDGVTVTGIRVFIEGYNTTGTGTKAEIRVSLVKAGVLTGTATVVELPYTVAVEAEKTLGSSSDLWGATFTPAEIRAAGFGVGITDDNTTASDFNIDYVRVKVDVSPPSLNTGDLISCFDCHIQTATAHGGAVTLRAGYDRVSKEATKLCNLCHQESIYWSGTAAPTGKTAYDGSVAQATHPYELAAAGYHQASTNAEFYGCRACHSSKWNADPDPARRLMAEDAHGFNKLVTGYDWSVSTGASVGSPPFTFFRNSDQILSWRPKSWPGQTALTGGYCEFDGTSATHCGDGQNRSSLEYKPGGTY